MVLLLLPSERAAIRVAIDGCWSCDEFSELLRD